MFILKKEITIIILGLFFSFKMVGQHSEKYPLEYKITYPKKEGFHYFQIDTISNLEIENDSNCLEIELFRADAEIAYIPIMVTIIDSKNDTTYFVAEEGKIRTRVPSGTFKYMIDDNVFPKMNNIVGLNRERNKTICLRIFLGIKIREGFTIRSKVKLSPIIMRDVVNAIIDENFEYPLIKHKVCIWGRIY
jgi:hypothetical protein